MKEIVMQSTLIYLSQKSIEEQKEFIDKIKFDPNTFIPKETKAGIKYFAKTN